MNIALCTDDNYAMACGVCIISILETNKTSKYNIYVLTEKLSDLNKSKFEQIESKYHQKTTIIVIKDDMLEGLKVSKRFNKSIYFRFLLQKLLPNETSVLYLDCDIIVNGSLMDLSNLDLNNYACAAVEDQMDDDIRLRNRVEMEEGKLYFNSGFLLINLDYWRRYNIAEKCIRYISENPEKCIYPDQDALNAILLDKVLFMPYRYNFQALMYNKEEERFLARKKWKEIEEWKNNPIIIHYTDPEKPWYKECKHKYKQLFLDYKSDSPWHSCKIIRSYSLKKTMIMHLKKLIKQ